MKRFAKKLPCLSSRAGAMAFAISIGLAVLPKALSLDFPDFKVFYTAARHALHDPENIYRLSPDRYLYAPGTSLLIIPFSLSSHWLFHAALWHCLLTYIAYLLARRSYAALFSSLLLTRYLLVSMAYGQINMPVVALLLFTQWLLDRGDEEWAGALWAVVASVKVYPLVLGAEFAIRKKWRGFLAFVGTAIALAMLPFFFFGVKPAWRLYQEFCVALYSKGLPVDSHNQSIIALFSRLFTPEPFDLQGVGKTQWGIFPLGALWARGLGFSIGVLLTVFSWRRAKRAGGGFLSAAAFSVLFLSHIVWKDYLLLLYFPMVDLLGNTRIPGRKRVAWVLVIFSLVTFTSPDIVGSRLAALFDAASIHLWGAVLVWVAWINYLSPSSLFPETRKASSAAR